MTADIAAVTPSVLLAALFGAVVANLQGCGGGGDHPTPTPSPPSPPLGPTPHPTAHPTAHPTPHPTAHPTPHPTPSPPGPSPHPSGWKLAPIVVRGQQLYNSMTNEQFHAKGIGFPIGLSDSNIQDWLDVLTRIHTLSSNINMVRVYTLPSCWVNGCMEVFMKKADELGIYVLVPGTGTTWGWLPIDLNVFGGADATADKAYKAGNVLGFGQKILSNFNFPNVLGVVIGNEFDQQKQMWRFQAVIKAYARDLKAYMNMCNTDANSATKGKMRKVPLFYASSDDRGNAGASPKASYYMCGSEDVSIDVFGLNVERWCDPTAGRKEYVNINDWVGNLNLPGSFMFTEMGCAKNGYANKTRDWQQLPKFETSFPNIAGYAAYVYYGNPDFNMFSGASSTAPILPDGEKFFKELNGNSVSTARHVDSAAAVTAPRTYQTCATTLLGTTLDSVESVHKYDTGLTGEAGSCPKPLESADAFQLVV